MDHDFDDMLMLCQQHSYNGDASKILKSRKKSGQKTWDCCGGLGHAGAETWENVAFGEQPGAGGTKQFVLAAHDFSGCL